MHAYTRGFTPAAYYFYTARGTPTVLRQWSKSFHNHCQPRELCWQWSVKNAPDIQRCSQLTLKKKAPSKRRLLSLFGKKEQIKKEEPYSCEMSLHHPVAKPETWLEYWSFLLPAHYTKKPPMVTCRKMLEHRRRQCAASNEYAACQQGECWPVPTEWYGQGVLHVAELALSKEQPKLLDVFKSSVPKPFPPCDAKLPDCPTKQPTCPEEFPRKMPFSQFPGGSSSTSPSTPAPFKVNCPVKHHPVLLPSPQQARNPMAMCSNFISNRPAECPDSVAHRYSKAENDSKDMMPPPTSIPEYKPQREVKKGVCGRQSFLRPPSARNFHTGRPLQTEFPEYYSRVVNSSHLQPDHRPFNINKLLERAGMDTSKLFKTMEPQSPGHKTRFTSTGNVANENLPNKTSVSSKTKLQSLTSPQEEYSFSQMAGGKMNTTVPPILKKTTDLEDVAYQRREFHRSTSSLWAKKKDTKASNEAEDKICSGCPGILGGDVKPKNRFSNTRGGVRGKCRTQRAIRPEDRLNPLAMKCKPPSTSLCSRSRSDSFMMRAARGVHSSCPDQLPVKERYIFSNNTTVGNWVEYKSFSKSSKDPMDSCKKQLETISKLIDSCKSSEEGGHDKDKKGGNGKGKQDPCEDADMKKAKDKGEEDNTEGRKNLKSSKSSEDTPGGSDKAEDPCKPKEQAPLNCKKIVEKKKRIEECAKYLEKQNDKLKNELAELKKKQAASASDAKVCDEIEQEKKKIEATVKTLLQENDKLKKELSSLKSAGKEGKSKPKSCPNKLSSAKSKCKSSKSKKQSSKSAQSSSKCGKNKGDSKAEIEKCVKMCEQKVKKRKLKREFQMEKKKCIKELKNKQKMMEEKEGLKSEDGMTATLLQNICCKLQDLADRLKKKPS